MVVDLPTEILPLSFAPVMFAGLHNHSPLLTMLAVRPYGGEIGTKMELNLVSCHWTINAMPLNQTSFYWIIFFMSLDRISFYWIIRHSIGLHSSCH